jgi:hypothetical protein
MLTRFVLAAILLFTLSPMAYTAPVTGPTEAPVEITVEVIEVVQTIKYVVEIENVVSPPPSRYIDLKVINNANCKMNVATPMSEPHLETELVQSFQDKRQRPEALLNSLLIDAVEPAAKFEGEELFYV